MKLTKSQLKQIIKEEINEALPIGTPWSVRTAAQGLGQPRWTPGMPEMEDEETDPIGAEPEMEEKDPDPTRVFLALYKAWTPKTSGERAYKSQLGEKLGFRTYETPDPSGYSGGTITTMPPPRSRIKRPR